eukprot:c33733_g1_i1.p2 GENE.c33733_g1_i1~~c33733_g1_i1.p2  ORF type:complete len:127 (+),score=31.47 c33733_g1_i1:139-519(+)
MASLDHLYRHSNLGYALTQSTEALIMRGAITRAVADKILADFEKAIIEAFKQVHSKAVFSNNKANSMVIYRNVDNIWTFVYPSMEFHLQDLNVTATKVKIIAVDVKKAVKAAKAPKRGKAAIALPE